MPLLSITTSIIFHHHQWFLDPGLSCVGHRNLYSTLLIHHFSFAMRFSTIHSKKHSYYMERCFDSTYHNSYTTLFKRMPPCILSFSWHSFQYYVTYDNRITIIEHPHNLQRHPHGSQIISIYCCSAIPVDHRMSRISFSFSSRFTLVFNTNPFERVWCIMGRVCKYRDNTTAMERMNHHISSTAKVLDWKDDLQHVHSYCSYLFITHMTFASPEYWSQAKHSLHNVTNAKQMVRWL